MYIIFRRVLGVKVKSSVKMMKPIVGGGQVAKYFVDIHGTFSGDNNFFSKSTCVQVDISHRRSCQRILEVFRDQHGEAPMNHLFETSPGV